MNVILSLNFKNYDLKITYLFFSFRISENYEIFEDLSRLEVKNLNKICDRRRIVLPDSEPLDEFLQEDDIVEFDVFSSDIWLDVILELNYEDSMNLKHMNQSQKDALAKFELKVERDMSITELKAYLHKSAIIIWNKIQMHSTRSITFYFP